MTRYIDADLLKKFVFETGFYCDTYDDKQYTAEIIDSFPAADVVERKHGKWMKHNDRACWYCSECKEDNYYAYSWNSDTGKYEFQDHFCPNCGAEMRKETEDEDNSQI